MRRGTRGGMVRVLRLLVLLVLVGVSAIYFMLPARASDDCRHWEAEMVEDEGGPVLKAMACSDDSTESDLLLACFDGTVWLSYDLVKGAARGADLEETAAVEFVTDGGAETVEMQYQDLDGLFAGSVPLDGALISLLQSQSSLLVRDSRGGWPAKTFSLAGSSAAIKTLAAACR